MNGNIRQLGAVTLLVGLLLTAAAVLYGCKEKSQPAASPEETAPAASAAIEQTNCPVMGGAINKNIFTEYKGKKVYFCCAACEDKFNAEPEKYVAKLPQFKD
ncbi:MAG: YHS domain-containing protein [Planctomycetota bacterium]|jgi:YHS domain-containing protein